MDTVTHSDLTMLQKLMITAGWHSNHRNLTEAAPHLSEKMSADDLVATLENLDIPLSIATARQDEITARDCPALFVDKKGNVSGILGVRQHELLHCHNNEAEPEWRTSRPVHGRLIRIDRFSSKDATESFESFRKITDGFSGLFPWMVIASFMTNLMGLATPLLIMMIYDKVIPAGSTSLVFSLALAAGLVLAADAGFRFARSKALAHMGRVVEHRLGLALFRKLMSLPPEQIRKSDVEQQIARFKQFEGLRDIFTGQILMTLLDLPFTLIFLALIFVLAPQVGFLVLGLVVVFILATVITLPAQQSVNSKSAASKSKQQKFLFETVNQHRNIYRLGLGDYWHQRYNAIAQDAASTSRIAKRFQHVSQAFGQSVMMIAGVGAIVLGTLVAMGGGMSFGALIAVMALVWKVLTPLQSLYANAPQILGFLKCRQQVDRVLTMPQEMVRGVASSHQKSYEGRITLNAVTHRFVDTIEPALSQVTLDIMAGEFVVIAGNNGSGKTTLLEIMMGLHQPLAGSLQLDGIDIRQIPVDDLRKSFSYGQKKPDVFYGTLLQNFRLVAPTAHLDDIEQMIEALALNEEIETWPKGLDTRLTESYRKTISPTISSGLALVRSFIRPAAVYLLNEPNTGLDYIRKSSLVEYLGRIKGKHTIILVSDDPEHIKLADRCIYMSGGRIVANDTALNGQRKMAALIAANKENFHEIS